MIVLLTDFGPQGLYTGQVKAVLARDAPGVPIVDLISDLPAHDPRRASHLLAALIGEFARGSIFLCVVDPGVGSLARKAIALDCDGRWLVGPDNGLLDIAAARSRVARCYDIVWRPTRLSRTFHGRDLFAPVAAAIARNDQSWGEERLNWTGGTSPDVELDEVVYIDWFGNALTGRRAQTLDETDELEVCARVISFARTYSRVPIGTAFWYANSLGLVEVAVNQGSAAEALGIRVGSPIRALARSPAAT